MIVVDASVLVEIVLRPHQNSKILSLIAGHEFVHAPSIVDLEVMNAFRKPLLRGEFSADDAERALAAYFHLRIERHISGPTELRFIWQLRDTITPYDAAYVALAKSLDLPLITTDKKLAKSASKWIAVQTAP